MEDCEQSSAVWGLWAQLPKTLRQEDSWNSGVRGQPEQHNEALPLPPHPRLREKETAPDAHIWEYHNGTRYFHTN